MAALNFPTSPATNDIYTANGESWQWNGTSWIGHTPFLAKVPAGGTTGQVLSKINATDYNTQWTTPTAPGGSTGQIQYNNAGAFAGAANVDIDPVDGLLSFPSAPSAIAGVSAGNVKIIPNIQLMRPLIGFLENSGYYTYQQPFLGQNNIAFTKGIVGSTTVTSMGMALSFTGTLTAATWASTSLHTSANRASARATAATTAVAGVRGAATNYMMGTSGTGLGGFHFVGIFGAGPGTNYATSRGFFGLRGSTAAPTDVSPATLTNVLGVGWESTDTNIQWYTGGATSAKNDTGVPVPRTSEIGVYRLSMWCEPGSSTVTMDLYDMNTGTDGQITAPATPAATTGLNVYGYISAGGTSTTVAFDLMSVYVESYN